MGQVAARMEQLRTVAQREGVRAAAATALDRLSKRVGPVVTGTPEVTPHRFEQYTVQRTFGDVELKLSIEDEIGRQWYDVDWPDFPEKAFFLDQGLSKDAIVFDLGAHQGVVALILASMLGPDGKVIAVEANARNVAVGSRNVQLNEVENVQYVHAAVANAPGQIRFGRGGNGQIDAEDVYADSETVTATTIDALAAAHGAPSLVVLDIEGYEGEALRGAEQTLSRPGVHWFIEVHVGSGLEEFGWTVDRLLAAFPADRFERFISNDYTRQPQRLDEQPFASTVMSDRFFLTALSR